MYGTLNDRRHDLPGPSRTVTTDETIDDVRNYFDKNPNTSIRKAAQVLDLKRETLRKIMRDVIKLHPYKITTHQLLTEKAMEKRVEFCKVITNMFESEELDEKQIIFTDEAHFWLNGYVNKQNYRFWGQENPNVSIAVPLHPQKVSAWAAISVKGVYLQFFEGTVTSQSYKELLETKFFPHAKKRGLVKNFHFMQDGATPHRTREVFESIHEVYGNRVIGLGYPKFAHGGLEWPPYSPDLNPCDFFLWGYLKDKCYAVQPQNTAELINSIKKCTRSIPTSMLDNVFQSFCKRLQFCANSNGQHFENIYH